MKLSQRPMFRPVRKAEIRLSAPQQCLGWDQNQITGSGLLWQRLRALCHPEGNVTTNRKEPESVPPGERLVLGIDTCGPSGSVALSRVTAERAAILSQTELAGRSYSASLVRAVDELLSQEHMKMAGLHAIVVVNGPGSFTGVRVGLSAVKGLAEPTGLPVVAVSRLGVLAHKAGTASSALDAHRRELFLRLSTPGARARELLAGQSELLGIESPPSSIAVCDEGSRVLLCTFWPEVEQVAVAAPTAADAIEWSRPKILAQEFSDLARLDGHYLRRSDAEIFGGSATAGKRHEQG
jgi:tRNA threonylcarbamoyladenosine biosynthesis protein TsaB